jgi:RNA polymerase sigma-70 factor (ECF subfamily)
MNNTLDFESIYYTYYPKIHHYLVRMTGSSEAEDIAQEVFIKINGSLNDFRPESKLSTWIYKIATNLALDKLRSASFRNHKKTDSISELGIELIDKHIYTENRDDQTDQQIIRKEMNKCIQNFIEELPENYKIVLVLSEFENLKNNEIADVLNISVDTVKIRLYRAKAKLKDVLNCNCNFYRDKRNILFCDLKKS